MSTGSCSALIDVKDKLGICTICNNISDGEVCSYCRDTVRDQSVICVVEEPHNILPIETTRQFNGLYHVLHGSISPSARHRAGAACASRVCCNGWRQAP